MKSHLSPLRLLIPLVIVLSFLCSVTVVSAQFYGTWPTCRGGNLPGQPCMTRGGLGRCISKKSICILEPLPESTITEITAADTRDLSAFYRYVNEGGVWSWVFGVGIGAAVTGGVIAGLQIVLSNGDSGKIEAGKNRFLWSTVGLLLLLLAGVILQFINRIGFQNV